MVDLFLFKDSDFLMKPSVIDNIVIIITYVALVVYKKNPICHRDELLSYGGEVHCVAERVTPSSFRDLWNGCRIKNVERITILLVILALIISRNIIKIALLDKYVSSA